MTLFVKHFFKQGSMLEKVRFKRIWSPRVVGEDERIWCVYEITTQLEELALDALAEFAHDNHFVEREDYEVLLQAERHMPIIPL